MIRALAEEEIEAVHCKLAAETHRHKKSSKKIKKCHKMDVY
jgi:hypothetical protein